MQQPHEREVISYAAIGEVRLEVQAATCNRLLAEGWVLFGVYPLTMVRDMEQQPANGEKKQVDASWPSHMIMFSVPSYIGDYSGVLKIMLIKKEFADPDLAEFRFIEHSYSLSDGKSAATLEAYPTYYSIY
jgi:hypothetical protein